MIDDTTGLAACPPYENKRVHQEIFEFWSSDLQEVFAAAGIPRRKPPENSIAPMPAHKATRRITSPLRDAAYVMRLPQLTADIAFNAPPTPMRTRSTGSSTTLMWAGVPGDPLYLEPPAAGHYRVRTVDDHGRSDERQLEVSLIE